MKALLVNKGCHSWATSPPEVATLHTRSLQSLHAQHRLTTFLARPHSCTMALLQLTATLPCCTVALHLLHALQYALRKLTAYSATQIQLAREERSYIAVHHTSVQNGSALHKSAAATSMGSWHACTLSLHVHSPTALGGAPLHCLQGNRRSMEWLLPALAVHSPWRNAVVHLSWL